MISPLSKAWDVMPVKANHSKELLHSRLGIDHREISDRVNFLGVWNTTIKSDNMDKYFKVSGEEGTHQRFKLHANLGGPFKYASVMFESVNMRHASDNQIINIRHAESVLMVTTACHVPH